MESLSALYNAFNNFFLVSDDFDSIDDVFPASDDSYAEELQFQEALEASLNLSSSHDHASSSRNTFSCQICTEDKPKPEMFEIEGCLHSFCQICISKHVEYKLQDNVVHVSCPDEDCNNVIRPDSLRYVMPPNIVAQWEGKMTESTILDSEKFYCPYENCSEMLVNDSDEGVIIRQSECPNCWRLFCAQCKVPWHQGFGCEEFIRLKHSKREKEKLRLLAKQNHWKKCPNCKVFVEKIDGCIHITCRLY
ncbi:hypothetical protein BUALT_Bualt02G0099500 [Buddleja alternifolia]|uniref:RBR-type E3 ubiquitin transferase n=1 Tax=Buddleja alternifolia TaxID=168488 RepID=A0AAV6YA33_9LAMI|nr:hypothetical protein BUALT_Bualt02G0099500 [Buddleja alternifolia]